MSPVVKKKLLAVLILFVVAIAMQLIVVTGNVGMIWASIAVMACASAFLYVAC